MDSMLSSEQVSGLVPMLFEPKLLAKALDQLLDTDIPTTQGELQRFSLNRPP